MRKECVCICVCVWDAGGYMKNEMKRNGLEVSIQRVSLRSRKEVMQQELLHMMELKY